MSFHLGCTSHSPSWLKEWAATDSITLYGNTAALLQITLVEFMCHCVCERHINLKLVVAEFNASWIA